MPCTFAIFTPAGVSTTIPCILVLFFLSVSASAYVVSFNVAETTSNVVLVTTVLIAFVMIWVVFEVIAIIVIFVILIVILRTFIVCFCPLFFLHSVMIWPLLWQ